MKSMAIGKWVLVLAIVCLAAGPVLADGDDATGAAVKSGQQIPGAGIHNAEDPGGSNSPGVPSHSDDWGGHNDNSSNGNWGSGNHPSGMEQALQVGQIVASIL